MDLMQPALMSRVIDVGVANADKAYIVRTCILMFVCALLGVTGGLGRFLAYTIIPDTGRSSLWITPT